MGEADVTRCLSSRVGSAQDKRLMTQVVAEVHGIVADVGPIVTLVEEACRWLDTAIEVVRTIPETLELHVRDVSRSPSSPRVSSSLSAPIHRLLSIRRLRFSSPSFLTPLRRTACASDRNARLVRLASSSFPPVRLLPLAPSLWVAQIESARLLTTTVLHLLDTLVRVAWGLEALGDVARSCCGAFHMAKDSINTAHESPLPAVIRPWLLAVGNDPILAVQSKLPAETSDLVGRAIASLGTMVRQRRGVEQRRGISRRGRE